MRGLRMLPALVCAACLFASCSPDVESRTKAYLRASSLFDRGKFEEAAAAAIPGGIAGIGAFAPSAVLRGKAFWFLGRLEDAEAELRAALRARSSSLEARLWLCRTLRSEGRTAEAARLAESILADDPEDTRTLRLASDLALDRTDTAAAAGFLERAIGSGGELGLAFLDRGRLRWISGDRKGAMRDLEAAEATLPSDGAAARAARALHESLKEARE